MVATSSPLSRLLVVVLSLRSIAAFVQRRLTDAGRCNVILGSTTPSTATTAPATNTAWHDDADKFLDPTTPPSKRQQLLSNLMKQNSNIRASVEQAFRDGTIDPLLTPTGRRVQEGTQTVARQIVQDILPNIFSQSPPKPQDVFNTNQRIFQSVTTQLQQTLETMASDLADPMARIPARIRHQTTAVASTVFSGTPVDLTEPTYRVVMTPARKQRHDDGGVMTAGVSKEEYEVREYDEYEVACTTVVDSVAVAYQRLAAYIAGANAEHRVITDVPVSMRTGNELRFFVPTKLPLPLTEDAGVHRLVDEAHKIRIVTIPAATLAVRRFTGFCTEGEIQRQKEILLNLLKMDESSSVELDVPHGQTVGHLVFEYNPPVAVPIVRRNEIAIPVFINNNNYA